MSSDTNQVVASYHLTILPGSVGSEPIDALAKKIWQSVGPSGRNKDYLYELSAAVKRLAPESHDSHLFALEVSVFNPIHSFYPYSQNGCRRGVVSWMLNMATTTRSKQR